MNVILTIRIDKMKTTIFERFISKNTCIMVLFAMLLTFCLYCICLKRREQSLQKREDNLRRVISEAIKYRTIDCIPPFASASEYFPCPEDLGTVPVQEFCVPPTTEKTD